MDPEIKAKWLTALRSGEYKQGVMYLRKDDSFCCLGVLSHQQKWLGARPDAQGVYPNENGLTTVLTHDQRAEIGLANTAHARLTEMNDGGKSFAEIADWIEANL